MRIKNKVVSILVAVSVASVGLMGCASEFDASETVMTVGMEDVSAGVANFYARYQQAMYETYYASFMGEDMWVTSYDGETSYEESVKETLSENLKQLYVVKQHADELGVALTEEEVNAIEETAAEFLEKNTFDSKEVVSATLETVVEVLSLYKLEAKANAEIIKGVDTEVSDEEAAQKKMTYVQFAFSTLDEDGNSVDLTEDEKVALKVEAEEFLQASMEDNVTSVAQEKEYEAIEVTFDAESTSANTDLIAAADLVEEGGYTDVVETESGYFVAQVTSLLDRDATDAKKDSIVLERENALYQETLEAWVEEVEIEVDESVWSKIDFQRTGVLMLQEEEEPYTTGVTGE